MEDKITARQVVIPDLAILRVLAAVIGDLLLEINPQLRTAHVPVFVEVTPPVFESVLKRAGVKTLFAGTVSPASPAVIN